MSGDLFRLREAFHKPISLWVKVTPQGFLFTKGGTAVDEIIGRITRRHLLRKLFRGGKLLCHSEDGLVSRSGLRCEECLHPHCRALVRVTFLSSKRLHVFELSGRSAENLLEIEEEAVESGVELVDWVIRLKVIDRGSFGEVTFERVSAGGPIGGG